MTTLDRYAALQCIRQQMWAHYNRIAERGIFLVWRTRYKGTAASMAADLRALGADVTVTKKSGKGTTGHGRTYRLEFTVDIPADAYLMKRLNLRELKTWDSDWAELQNG